jgi:crotonobetainyl-CoA:carnitine CoA-transferase CaiB-like acyl-CoA transferase
MPFKIRYKFRDDPKINICVVSYQQYRNFCELPIIQDCTIVKKNQKTTKKNLDQIERALELAFKNQTNHIRNLSENQ